MSEKQAAGRDGSGPGRAQKHAVIQKKPFLGAIYRPINERRAGRKQDGRRLGWTTSGAGMSEWPIQQPPRKSNAQAPRARPNAESSTMAKMTRTQPCQRPRYPRHGGQPAYKPILLSPPCCARPQSPLPSLSPLGAPLASRRPAATRSISHHLWRDSPTTPMSPNHSSCNTTPNIKPSSRIITVYGSLRTEEEGKGGEVTRE